MTTYRHGWHPDVPDHRDRLLMLPTEPIPSDVDLRPLCPPVYDDQHLQACQSSAVAAALHYLQASRRADAEPPSRLFLYWAARHLRGLEDVDCGASIRDALRALCRWGVPPESRWPFDADRCTSKPVIDAWAAARTGGIVCSRVGQAKVLMMQCLGMGTPIICGIPVYAAFDGDDVAHSGMVPMPGDDEPCLGGHAVLLVGFRSSDQMFICRNNRGQWWGDHGYFYLPEPYLMTLGRDFWVVRSAS